uniref:Uncharacterized protein n=1 Tax=Glossina brevipalpis TaxID=37001 RepID=A0A1A9WV74_9MUSC
MIKFAILWIICYFISNVWSDCILKIPKNKENAPLWQKKIGENWFKIPYISDRLQLQDGEIVNGYCATKFRNIAYDVTVAIHCKSYDRDCSRSPRRRNSLKHRTDFLGEHPMVCDDIEWTINVETNQNNDSQTSWCKPADHQIFDLRTNNLDQNLVLNDLPEATTLSNAVKFLNTTILHIGDGKNPDLYIFAYNSPYAMFFNSSQVKFCSNICNEINWLNYVRSTFDYLKIQHTLQNYFINRQMLVLRL